MLKFKIHYKKKLNLVFLLLLSTLYPGYSNASSINSDLQQLVDDFRIKSHAPAAVLSMRSPNQVNHFTSGTVRRISAENPNPPKITTEHLFQIGCNTKPFTAIVLLQLEAEGKISINDTIAEVTQKYGSFLPKREYQLWKGITIKQLLNMTSGIFDIVEDETGNKEFMEILARYPEKQWKPIEIFRLSSKYKPYFPPGKGWHYSNPAYNLLGSLVEAVTKHSFEYEMNQRIFKKYDLNHTFYLPYEYPDNIMQKMAHGYVYSGSAFSPPMKSGSDMTRFNMSPAGPAGAMVSNSTDLTRWAYLLFTGKILAPQQLKEMLTTVCRGNDKSCVPGEVLSDDSHSDGFGLGFARMHDPQLGIIWFNIGNTPGYYSAIAWIPNKKTALALTLSADSKEAEKILKTLVKAAKLVTDESANERHHQPI